MFNRRKFISSSTLGTLSLFFANCVSGQNKVNVKGQPLVLSTWDAGIRANKGAWEILGKSGAALDAVEAGVRVTELENNCCVGLKGNPDREGFVTLDACIMDHQFNCGSVAGLERIKHPISVARRIMEKTPHVFLIGEGAQQFAVAEGFNLESPELSQQAKENYANWLKKSEYKPIINIENKAHQNIEVPKKINGDWNHDTIGMIAMDTNGNMSGSCTTSGMAFKMRGRIGDSPIIGAGLYVDNEVGCCTATGQGEEVIRVGGALSVVEAMRQGLSPEEACKNIIERIVKIRGDLAKDFQVAFIAMNNLGEYGSYSLHPGFSFAVKSNDKEELIKGKSYYDK